MRRCHRHDVSSGRFLALFSHASAPQVVRDGVLCAGLYPQVAVGAEADGRAVWTVGSGKVAVHPSSVNHGVPNLVKSSPFLLFHEKMLTTQVFIRECSAVSPAVRQQAAAAMLALGATPHACALPRSQGLLLFGGAVEVQYTQGTASVDGSIRLRVDAQTAVLIKTLRIALDRELGMRIARPAAAADATLLPTIVAVLSTKQQQ